MRLDYKLQRFTWVKGSKKKMRSEGAQKIQYHNFNIEKAIRIESTLQKIKLVM